MRMFRSTFPAIVALAAAVACGALPAIASATAGQSPFRLTGPKGGSASTDVRVKFSWTGSCPTGEECTLKVEGTRQKNPPRSELGTGEFDTNKLDDDSYFQNSLSKFGPIGPGTERVRDNFEVAGLWYLQLVSSYSHKDESGHYVDETHTSPLTTFVVKPIARRPRIAMVTKYADRHYFSVETFLTGNVRDYDVATTFYRRVKVGRRIKNIKVRTEKTNVRCHVEEQPGFSQTDRCRNYVTWKMPNARWVRKGAAMRVVSVIRTKGWKRPVAVVAQNTRLD